MAKVIFHGMILLHTEGIIRGWIYYFVNYLNTVFVNIILAVGMLLPYHPLVLQDEVVGRCSPVHLWSKGPKIKKTCI